MTDFDGAPLISAKLVGLDATWTFFSLEWPQHGGVTSVRGETIVDVRLQVAVVPGHL